MLGPTLHRPYGHIARPNGEIADPMAKQSAKLADPITKFHLDVLLLVHDFPEHPLCFRLDDNLHTEPTSARSGSNYERN